MWVCVGEWRRIRGVADLGVLRHLLEQQALGIRILAQAVFRLQDVAAFIPARREAVSDDVLAELKPRLLNVRVSPWLRELRSESCRGIIGNGIG